MHDRIRARLEKEGLLLPQAPTPVAAYIPAVRVGQLAFSSGQLPIKEAKLQFTGRLTADLSVEEGYEAARLAALNALAALGGVVDLDRITKIVRVGGFVQSEPSFHDQPKVVNGASELLRSVFDEAGQHARSAIGVAALPLDAAVEIEIVVAL